MSFTTKYSISGKMKGQGNSLSARSKFQLLQPNHSDHIQVDEIAERIQPERAIRMTFVSYWSCIWYSLTCYRNLTVMGRIILIERIVSKMARLYIYLSQSSPRPNASPVIIRRDRNGLFDRLRPQGKIAIRPRKIREAVQLALLFFCFQVDQNAA